MRCGTNRNFAEAIEPQRQCLMAVEMVESPRRVLYDNFHAKQRILIVYVIIIIGPACSVLAPHLSVSRVSCVQTKSRMMNKDVRLGDSE